MKKYAGSGWGSFRPTSRIRTLTRLQLGTILLEQSETFQSRNVLRVVAVFADKMHVIYANPKDPLKNRLATDSIHCVWDFQLTLDSNKYFRTRGGRK